MRCMSCMLVVGVAWLRIAWGCVKYAEFHTKMAAAHNRILEGVGVESFRENVVQQLPLVLDDDAVISLAEGVGFQMAWFQPKTKAPPPKDGNLAAMFQNQAALAKAPMGPAPGGVRPPPPRPVSEVLWRHTI